MPSHRLVCILDCVRDGIEWMAWKMNDFTKEELEDLHLVYRTFCTEDGTQAMRKLTNLETGILDKIKSLIDNYCEHKKDIWPLYPRLGYLPAGWLCYECNKLVDKESDDN